MPGGTLCWVTVQRIALSHSALAPPPGMSSRLKREHVGTPVKEKYKAVECLHTPENSWEVRGLFGNKQGFNLMRPLAEWRF